MQKTGSRKAAGNKKEPPPAGDSSQRMLMKRAGLGLCEALQQIVQAQEGLIDHVDVVDDGACTGEDAGDVVEHLTNIQEVVVSVAGTTVQIDHFLFADGGIVCGQFHSRHNSIPFHF